MTDPNIRLPFADRIEAGRVLAARLRKYEGRNDVIVLGLPRGGMPVAYQVALKLRAPLDVFVVRKLGVPGHAELAMGAIATGGVRVVNEKVLASVPNAEEALEEVTAIETLELERRERQYRQNIPPPELGGRIVILVDDGLATGATMRAAASALRQLAVSRIVVAVPVGPPETCAELREIADEAVCAAEPEDFFGVGQFYANFPQTSDEEVRDLLNRAHEL